MKLIKSFTNDNAVKVVAFAINFAKELTTDEILNFVNSANENKYLNSIFTTISNQEEIAMTLSPDTVPKHTQSIGGIVANIVDNERLIWNLEANKSFVAIRCYEYTGWQSVYNRASTKFEEVFKILNNENIAINSIMLEYLDEFEILNPTAEWKKELFNQECPFLLKNIYELDDFWHVNHGYFKNLDILNGKLLDNHHINYFADASDYLKHKVNIRMQHKLIYENMVAYKKESIDGDFDKLHIHTKEIFNQIIHENIWKSFA